MELCLELKNFATVSRSGRQQNSSTVEPVDHTYDGRRVVAVYYTSLKRNTLTQLLHLFWICTTCSYSCAAVEISTGMRRRAVRLR